MLSTRLRGYSGLAGALTIILLLAGCSPGPEEGTNQTSQHAGTEETTAASGTAGTTRMEEETKADDIVLEQIAQGQRGPARRQVVVAGSARELAEATGVKVPNSGGGLYVSAHAGEQPTGGYQVAISSTAPGEIQVTLREPGEGAIVTQALTQPYAVAVVKTAEGGVPEAGDLRFVNAAGEPLGWTVARAGATGG
jgi:cytoskeletal protein RodZ